VKDLDVVPKDPSFIMSGNLKDDPIYMEQVLAKLYASFIIAGQGSGTGKGADIRSGDENFFTTMRAFWNLQEITTDEAICGWSDVGIADLNTQTWSITNPFLTAVYQRLSLSITYVNDFIVNAKESDVAEKNQYIAEARFLRALAYYWLMDLFGNPPFTTESDGVGKYFPKQTTHAEIFNYIISELKDIESDLPAPGYSYPQADKGACWMLLARTYLNAEVYTGTPMWDSCKEYCDKVINSGAYSLAADYRHNFTADNGYNDNPEMIFAWEQDGKNTQGWVGTTFIIESCSDAVYIRAEDFHGLTSNTNWNGNRARKEFVDILVDTLATYGGPIPSDDILFTQCPDGRVYLSQKLSIDIPSSTSSGDYGTGVYKFTAKNYDGSEAENHSNAYASTDYPVFRLAEAYLMRAEALHNMEDDVNAAADINVIRERAYGDASGNITPEQVTDDFILDEHGREFYYEAHRRTDLIRFGKYTNGDYNWQWKGGVKDGVNTSPHRNLFPIPGDEISANPNLTQNPGY
jgi:hypothetical protein